jgi:hypothetical protein
VAASGKRSFWKRWRRRLLFAIGGAVVLFALLVVVLHTSWGKDRVRGRLEAALGKQVRGSVSIRTLDYDFPFGDLRVGDIEIRDANNAPAIAVEELELSLGLWSTITEKLSVQSLSVRGVTVNTQIAEDGRNSLRRLFIKRQGGNGRGFSVRSVRIEGLHWKVTKDDGDTISLRDGALQARVEKGEDTEVFLDAFSATFSATRGQQFSVEGAVRQDGAVLRTNPERTVLRLQPLQTTLEVKRLGKPTVTSSVQISSGELTLTPTSLLANVKQIVLGPLAIEEASAALGFDRGNPAGHQDIQLTGMALDTKTVAKVLQRELPVGRATGQVSIVGPLEKLAVLGTLQTEEGQIALTGTVDVTGPKAPAYSLSTTTDISVASLPSLTNSPLRIGPLLPTKLRILVSGEGLPSDGGSLSLLVEGLRTIDGQTSKTLSVRAHKEGALLQVDALRLKLLGSELAGTGSMDTAEPGGDMTAKLTLSGNAKHALARLEELGLRVSPPLHLPSELFLDLELGGRPDERITVTVLPSNTAIAGGRVKLQGEAVFEPNGDTLELTSADGAMTVQGLSIAGLARLARKPAKVRGRIDGAFVLRQRGDTRTVSHNLTVHLAEMNLDIASRGQMRRGQWEGHIGVHTLGERQELASIDGRLPLAIRRGVRLRKRGQVRLGVEMAPLLLSDHLERLPVALRERLGAKLHEAKMGLSLHLEGTVQAPRGRLTLMADVNPAKQPETVVGVKLVADLEHSDDGELHVRPQATISHSKLGETLASVGGAIRVLPNRRRPKDSQVFFDVTGDVGKRPLASLAPLLPPHAEKIRALVGDLEARLHLQGSPKNPKLHADVSLGASNPMRLAVEVEKSGNQLSVDVQSAIRSLELSEVWPGFAPRLITDPLLLSSDLGVKAELSLGPKPSLSDVSVRGTAKISGASIAVPQSNRAWRDVSLAVRGKGTELSLEVEASEEDAQASDRHLALTASANVTVGETVQLGIAEARLETKKWLLFGGPLGLPDGPRATLDSEFEIRADLGQEIPLIDVTATSLSYWDPDREVFTHGFTDISPKGDLVFLGDENRPLGVLGPVLENETAINALPAKPKARVRLHLPKPVHIAKGPLQLRVRGDVEQMIPSAGPTGTLEILDGSIVFFGQAFPFTESNIVLDGGPPKVEIFFADEVAPDILRQLSRESAGSNVQIHLRPVGGGPLIAFGGAGNASMMESLSLLYTGHGYVLARPEAPASVTVRAPQGMHPLMIAFIKANIPKLDLLDRFAVWSRPFDVNTTYGQMLYLDATRFLGDGSSRLRLMSRPQQIGRSRSEAHLDRLFYDSESVQLGVGLRAGSRLGGGVGVFFEWTSDD